MADDAHYTRLAATTGTFSEMMEGFGVVTVMNAQVFAFNPAIMNGRKTPYETIAALVTKNDKVGYMPDANNITLKIVAEKHTGKLLGGQAVGVGDSDKRINTLTTALLAGLTVDEFERNDITYAPPYAPTIDPLLNAAQILRSKVER